jgi:hypothetical protein
MPTDQVRGLKAHRKRPAKGSWVASSALRTTRFAQPDSRAPRLRFPVPFLSFWKWKRSMVRLYWLVAEYRITCAVFEKL